MIVVRSPLRISLGGGGTDLPSYYERFGGAVLSAAIDKYVFVVLHRKFTPGFFLKYSKMENVERIDEINHPIIRECLTMTDCQEGFLEIAIMADIPAGTGLGSSGSFTTALLKGLHCYKREVITARDLAEEACEIEINRLGEPVGKQDQYISAFGGIVHFEFAKDRPTKVTPLRLAKQTLHNLEDQLLLFYTGQSRSASSILKDQHERSMGNDQQVFDNLNFIKDLGQKSFAALERGNLYDFGELMNSHWEYKKMRSPGMSNDQINHWYDIALKNGAVGGKLIGAGGGGFLMFYASDPMKLRSAFDKEGLEEVRFRFDFDGTKVLDRS